MNNPPFKVRVHLTKDASALGIDFVTHDEVNHVGVDNGLLTIHKGSVVSAEHAPGMWVFWERAE